MMSPGRFWSWQGRIGRASYTWWGLGLFFLKYNLDRIVAFRLTGTGWYPWSYLTPERSFGGASAPQLGWILLAMSLPFIALGIVLTVRRLRDIGWPLPLVVLFFVPFINLVFFAALCVLPPRDEDWQTGNWMERLARVVSSESRMNRALIAVVLTVVLVVPLVMLGTLVLEDYGWGLFVGVPFFLGMLTAMLDGPPGRGSLGRALGLAMCSLLLSGGLCLLFALEGLICLIMALPLAAPLALLGAFVGWFVQKERHARRPSDGVRVYGVAAFVLPVLLAGEARNPAAPPLVEATTTIIIQAPPATVWNYVVAFGELPPPGERIFLAGIAYPVRARLEGHGVGATRYCEFSTGPFVEPITAWEENRLLAFDVVSQPPPMREWSPYANLHPAHLNGFFQSERGQFLLTPLDGGTATLVEGTTWYRQRIWPQRYWRAWSDYLIHAIHGRVLDHIRTLAEAEQR